MKIFHTLIFILLGQFVFGQESGTNVFKPHIYFGLVTSQVGGDRFAGFNKLGFEGGLGLKTKFSDNLGLSMDLGYIQKGSRKQSNPKNNDYSYYRMALQYVEVPLYITYYQDRFNFDAGFAISYLIGHSEETEGGIIREEDFFFFNTLDYSFLLGFEYALNEKWKLNTRYSHSIVPFRDFNGNPIGPIEAGQYNAVLMFKIVRQLAQ